MVFHEAKLKAICSQEIAKNWMDAADDFPDFLTPAGKEEKSRNEAWITENMERLKNHFSSYSPMRRNQDAWRGKAEELLNVMTLSEPIAGIRKAMDEQTFSSFQDKLKDLLIRIRSFDPDLSLPDMGQAVRNYLVYAIFRELNGLPQRCAPLFSVTACSTPTRIIISTTPQTAGKISSAITGSSATS